MKKLIELTCKESILKGTRKMPDTLDLKHGDLWTGYVVAENSNGFIVKFWDNLKGYIRHEDYKKHGPSFPLKQGVLVDVYHMF